MRFNQYLTELFGKNKKKEKQSTKFKLHDTVREKNTGFKKVGRIHSLQGGSKFEVRWNIGTYSVVDEKDIEKF